MNMDNYIQNQLQISKNFDFENSIGLILRAEKYDWNREQTMLEAQTEKWFERFSGVIHFTTTFAVSFSVLFIIFNFQAYSSIATNWVGATLFGPNAFRTEKVENSALPYVAIASQGETQELALGVPLSVEPPDFRIELEEVFEGSIPVVEADPQFLAEKEWVKFEGKIQEDLRKGVVHYPYTAMPGQIGNVFITGHSSYYPWDPGKYKSVFALLPNVESGKIITVDYKGKAYHYRINKKYEVTPDEVNVLRQPQDKKMLTLMTCTPVGTTLKRLIVEAEMVEEELSEI